MLNIQNIIPKNLAEQIAQNRVTNPEINKQSMSIISVII